MKIISFEFSDPYQSKFELPRVEFNNHMNLFVGPSGSGKTRLLNMLFNVSRMAVKETSLGPGKWKMAFEHEGSKYLWSFDGSNTTHSPGATSFEVHHEKLWAGLDEENSSIIFDRTGKEVTFDGTTAPKISNTASGISTYREEILVTNAFQGLKKIHRRNFFSDQLQNSYSIQAYPYQLMERLKARNQKRVQDLLAAGDSVHLKLFLIKTFFPRIFTNICEQFKLVFPLFETFIVSAAAKHLPETISIDAPMILMKEKGIAKGSPLQDISSGMQKVLLIIIDIFCCPSDGIYMIDEYENSLGANAIDFIPSFLAEFGADIQFMFTTHHPVLINEISIDSWLVFHRVNSQINVINGKELAQKYGKSKQKNFTQLLNDPLFKS